VLLEGAEVKIPDVHRSYAAGAASILGKGVWQAYPLVGNAAFIDGKKPSSAKEEEAAATELILNQSWRPSLTLTGMGGLPPLATAGNVLRPQTTVVLSIRLPPTANPSQVEASLRAAIVKPPYNAQVTLSGVSHDHGWTCPEVAPWLESSLQKAGRGFFNTPPQRMGTFVTISGVVVNILLPVSVCLSIGRGGSIPFMAMLGAAYPKAQFVVTGVLGPGSNAHGPNEFLHLPVCAHQSFIYLVGHIVRLMIEIIIDGRTCDMLYCINYSRSLCTQQSNSIESINIAYISVFVSLVISIRSLFNCLFIPSSSICLN
jgi:acetylornithine deacetylase/succinyl-diaminopimelate desuccinylase-like protein